VTAAVVARGVLQAGVGDGTAAVTAYYPGDSVDLPDDEIARLTVLRVLLDPNFRIVPNGDDGGLQVVET
jgi:hypothetical protein